MSRSFPLPLLLAALLLTGCAKEVDDDLFVEVDDDLFVEVAIEQLRVMFDDKIAPEEALERAVEAKGTSVEEYFAYQVLLEADPDHLRAVQDRINRATEELFTPPPSN